MGVSCDICKYGCEHDYVKRIMDRVPYALPETQEKMDILAAEMGEYMDERIRNKK